MNVRVCVQSSFRQREMPKFAAFVELVVFGKTVQIFTPDQAYLTKRALSARPASLCLRAPSLSFEDISRGHSVLYSHLRGIALCFD